RGAAWGSSRAGAGSTDRRAGDSSGRRAHGRLGVPGSGRPGRAGASPPSSSGIVNRRGKTWFGSSVPVVALLSAGSGSSSVRKRTTTPGASLRRTRLQPARANDGRAGPARSRAAGGLAELKIDAALSAGPVAHGRLDPCDPDLSLRVFLAIIWLKNGVSK